MKTRDEIQKKAEELIKNTLGLHGQLVMAGVYQEVHDVIQSLAQRLQDDAQEVCPNCGCNKFRTEYADKVYVCVNCKGMWDMADCIPPAESNQESPQTSGECEHEWIKLDKVICSKCGINQPLKNNKR